jgi:hypothetical protein
MTIVDVKCKTFQSSVLNRWETGHQSRFAPDGDDINPSSFIGIFNLAVNSDASHSTALNSIALFDVCNDGYFGSHPEMSTESCRLIRCLHVFTLDTPTTYCV